MYACPECYGPTRPPARGRDGRCPRCRRHALKSAAKKRAARKAASQDVAA